MNYTSNIKTKSSYTSINTSYKKSSLYINQDPDYKIQFQSSNSSYVFDNLYNLIRNKSEEEKNFRNFIPSQLSFLNITFSSGYLYEFSGENGSGKSQFIIWISCLLAIAYNRLYNDNNKYNFNVLIIYSEVKTKYIHDKISLILEGMCLENNEKAEVKKRIFINYCLSAEEYETFLSLIENYIEMNGIKSLFIDDLSVICGYKTIEKGEELTKEYNLQYEKSEIKKKEKNEYVYDNFNDNFIYNEKDNYVNTDTDDNDHNIEESNTNDYNEKNILLSEDNLLNNKNFKKENIVSFIRNHKDLFKHLTYNNVNIFITNSVNTLFNKSKINENVSIKFDEMMRNKGFIDQKYLNDKYIIYDKFGMYPKLGETFNDLINTRIFLFNNKSINNMTRRFYEIIYSNIISIKREEFKIQNEGILIVNSN